MLKEKITVSLDKLSPQLIRKIVLEVREGKAREREKAKVKGA